MFSALQEKRQNGIIAGIRRSSMVEDSFIRSLKF